MDYREKMEKYERFSKIAVIVGITAAIVAILIGIIGILVERSRMQESKVNMDQVFQEVEGNEDEGTKTAALMVDTRAEGGETEEGNLAERLADIQVYFAGIEDAVISEDTVIYLENLKENGDILMQYEITDKGSGETLETTGLIPSGEHVEWVPGKALKKGVHTLIMHESPFYSYDGEYFALTQGNNEVTFTIR